VREVISYANIAGFLAALVDILFPAKMANRLEMLPALVLKIT
jgi:hypothetical protein